MTEIASLKFVDGESGDEGWAGIRVEGKRVGLTLSLPSNGDVEVFLEADVLGEVIRGLTTAQAMISPARKEDVL